VTPRVIVQATKRAIAERGWMPGTTEEDRVAFSLARLGVHSGSVSQQHRVGRYRLDFAFTKTLLDLEVDGHHHFTADGAVRDALRDAWLRSQGWTVVRVDYRLNDDQLAKLLVNVVRYQRAMTEMPRGVPGVAARRRALAETAS
jgi:very-short-patch-repair endonuclease